MTLVEVMLVVFIIGLVSGLVVMTLPSNPSPEVKAARDFSQALARAQDQAALTGQPVGVVVTDRGYSMRMWRVGRWDYIDGGAVLSRGVRLNIVGERAEGVPEDWPDLVIDPGGAVDGAVFNIRGRRDQLKLTLDASGEVRLETY